MRVLFMMPNYTAVSEPWMHRMLQGIREHVAGIASLDIQEVATELQDIPHFEVGRVRRGRSVLEKLSQSWLFRHSDLRAFIKKHKITHVLCHYGTFSMPFLKLFEQLDVPVLVHFHGYDATFDLREQDGSPVHAPDYQEKIVQLSKSAWLIANSSYTKTLLVSAGVAQERVFTKPLGVEPAPAPRQHKEDGPVQVLFVGRMIECKGPDLAVQVFERAINSGLDAHFTLVGDGPKLQDLQSLVHRSSAQSRITLTGPLPSHEVDRLLENTDIYLQHNLHGKVTRREEAYGVSILEAMARGIPALVSRSGGVPDVVGPLADTLMVEPEELDAQANLLLELGRDVERRNELGRLSWEWVRDHRSAFVEAKELTNILKEVV